MSDGTSNGMALIALAILMHGCTLAYADEPQAAATMPIRSGIISYADTLASCQIAMADDYRSCGLLPDCGMARAFCPTMIAEIEPAAGNAEEENIGLDVWVGSGREWVIFATDLGD